MLDEDIIEKVKIALLCLLNNDGTLLRRDLSEQSMTHKLAEYLQPLFVGYNVDCEYNGNVKAGNGRKRIDVIKNALLHSGLLREKEQGDDNDLIERAVFPDIIVHVRESIESNICIIEVKKSTSTVGVAYDFIKLSTYTRKVFANDLNYQLGIFIELATKSDDIGYTMLCFKDGEMVTQSLQ